MVPRFRVVRGSSGIGVLASAARAVASAAMGLGRPASVKLWPPGTGDRDLKAPAAEGLGDGRVGAGAVENDVGGDAAGEGALIIEVANAAQVALALFADVAQEQERDRQLHLGVRQSMHNGQHANHARAVVAGARRFQAVDAVVLHCGTDGGAFRRETRCRDEPTGRRWAPCFRDRDRPDRGIREHCRWHRFRRRQPGLGKTAREPLAAGLLAEGRRRNRHHLHLPVHDGFGIAMKPRERRVGGPLGSEGRDPSKGGRAGGERHTDDFRVAGVGSRGAPCENADRRTHQNLAQRSLSGGYSTECRNRPRAGAVGPAAARERAAIMAGISATRRYPRPTSSMVPTRLRTM